MNDLELPTSKCAICSLEDKKLVTAYMQGNGRYYNCPNCGYFIIDIMGYRFTPIINDENTKSLASYYIRHNSSIDNPIFIDVAKYKEIVDTVKLPTSTAQIDNLLKWFGQQSNNSLDTIDGFTKHLPALIGAKNQTQVINLLDQLFKDGYIEMENPTCDLRERAPFNGFCGHLTSKGLTRSEQLTSSGFTGHINTTSTSLTSLFTQENYNFEVKGSLKLNLDRLLKGDEQKVFDINIAVNGALKTTTGFLNTTGGTVVIGAIEIDKYSLDEIKKINYKKFSSYYLIGIEIENPDLDKYQLTLQELISSHISRELAGMIVIDFEEYEGFSFCKVTVHQASHKWYYLDGKFLVRDGNRTIELSAEDADNYKKRNPRL